MTDTAQRVAITCPACSPDLETVHEVLSPGGQATVRCGECGHVHQHRLPEERTVERKVVVSQDGESFTATTAVPADETIAVGEEFLLDTEEAIMTVRITSLELDGKRAESAVAEDVRTVWTRAVGNVSVSVTAHPKGGEGEETRSLDLQVPGDYEFVVGDTDQVGTEEFTIEGVMVRDDARGYDFERLDHEGDTVLAKDVKRLYVRDESTSAWSAW